MNRATSLIRFFMTLALDYLKDHKPQWKLRATLQNVKLIVPTTKASVEKNLIIADGMISAQSPHGAFGEPHTKATQRIGYAGTERLGMASLLILAEAMRSVGCRLLA